MKKTSKFMVVLVSVLCVALASLCVVYATWSTKITSQQNTIKVGQTVETLILGSADDDATELYPGIGSVVYEYTVDMESITKTVTASAEIEEDAENSVFNVEIKIVRGGEELAGNTAVADGDVVKVTVSIKPDAEKPSYSEATLQVRLNEAA